MDEAAHGARCSHEAAEVADDAADDALHATATKLGNHHHVTNNAKREADSVDYSMHLLPRGDTMVEGA